MAIMIPHIPHHCTPESHEKDIFLSLEKLSDDYYVFHSFKLVNLKNNVWNEHEIDFVIFNKYKGLLCMEAKAGQVYFKDDTAYYGTGIAMKHNPFRQANDRKWDLKHRIKAIEQTKNIVNHLKLLECVWFPGIDKNKLSKMSLPLNTNKNIILTSEDMEDPTDAIERIFEIKTANKIETCLSASEVDMLLHHVLCPSFDILPSKTLELDYKNEKLNALISEQSNLLNYLEDQHFATINGAAGTGKTMIAVEKARRHSVNNERVLFLCFNKLLCEHLEKTYKYDNVDYYTIDGYACKMCGTKQANYAQLGEWLESLNEEGTYEYSHIIIDEGQDFGHDGMNKVFNAFDKIISSTENGTFYIFYDKFQMVQSNQMLKYIENADCRLTLYKNCRNTKEIASTSLRPLGRTPKVFELALAGGKPDITFVETSEKTVLDNIIKKNISNGILPSKIQILSCDKQESSRYADWLDASGNYLYNNKPISFTTCRKFKGLEADSIILVDVDKNALLDKGKLFYVGASRARLALSIIANLTESECEEVICGLSGTNKQSIKNPQNKLAKMLDCKIILN